jgi:hypothetical protein
LSQSIIMGSNAQFQVQVSGNPPFTYQWHFNLGNLTDNGRVTGSQSNVLNLAGVQIGDAGSYQVLVSNFYGRTSSAPAVLTVLVPPSITTQPQSRTNLGGTTAAFSVTAAGTVPLSYQWRKNGLNLPGATGTGLSLPNVQLSDAGDYTVVITNVAGAIASQPAALSVLAPSLQVTSVTVPLEAWTGGAFVVSWTDTNAGTTTATGPWMDKVYLSPTNGQFQLNASQLLGSFPFTGNLTAGQSVKRVQTVTINRAGITNGQWYVPVLADANANVLGDSGANNPLGVSSNLSVYLTPLPDLVVSAVTAPGNGVGGQPVSVTWTVCNAGQGDTDIPYWFDHLYLSPTTNTSDAIADYGQYANPSYLVPADCYDQTATVNLPIGYGGLFNFIVRANATGALVEGNPTNNLGVSAHAINVQRVDPGFFHVQSVQVAPAPPTTTWAGQPATVTYTVKNTGQSPIGGTWDDRIALSPTNSYVNGVTTNGYVGFVGNPIVSGPLAPGASYTNSVSFNLPAGIAPGVWYVVPLVDVHFLAGNGNLGRDELSASLDLSAPPQSDLVAISVTAPTNGIAGQNVSLRWVVANQGVNQTSGSYWYDAIYLSTNPVFNVATSTLLDTFGYWGGLALGASYTNSQPVTLPAGAIGTNYIFVFSDAGSNVFEITLTNNMARAVQPLVVTPNYPAQLSVSSVSIPGTAVAGRTATISWVVQNNGPGTTSASTWLDSVYLSTGTQLNPSQAILLGSVQHNGALNPGGSYGQSQSFNLPACDAGTFIVFVQADSGGQVTEAGPPAQTIGSSTNSLRVLASPAASLQVYSISAPANATGGGSLAVTWTVLNTGNGTTNAP